MALLSIQRDSGWQGPPGFIPLLLPPRPALASRKMLLDLDGFQDAGSAWVVATVGAEVKWCFEGGWLRKAGGSQAGVWRRQSCQGSSLQQLDELVWRVAGLLGMPKVSGF